MGGKFYFFTEKNTDSAVFSAFYGQRSVTAAWATRSPWSIDMGIMVRLVICRRKQQERLGSGVGGFNMIRRHKWFKDFNWKGRILISLMNYFHLIQFFQIFAPRHSPPPSTQSSPVTLTPPALTASQPTYPAPLALHQGTKAMKLAIWSLEMNRRKE